MSEALHHQIVISVLAPRQIEPGSTLGAVLERVARSLARAGMRAVLRDRPAEAAGVLCVPESDADVTSMWQKAATWNLPAMFLAGGHHMDSRGCGVLVEALGLAEPYGMTTPPGCAEHSALCDAVGSRIAKLLTLGVRARSVVCAAALADAVAVAAAFGGGAQRLEALRQLALAADLDPSVVTQDTARVPTLVAERIDLEALHDAGGVPAVMRELCGVPGLLQLDRPTVSAAPLRDNLREARVWDVDLIAPLDAVSNEHAPLKMNGERSRG